MKNKKTLFFIIFILIVVPISMVVATFEMQTNWPPSPVPPELGGITLGPESTITELVAYLYQWGIALGGLITFIALLIAGFLYLTSVGDPAKMKDAIGRIKAAFLGLALLLGSWLILHTINPELTTPQEINFLGELPNIPIHDEQFLSPQPPCEYVLAFTEPNFGGTLREIKAGTKTSEDWVKDIKSFVVCKKIPCRNVRCRPIRQGETSHDLCPEEGQTVIKSDIKQIGKFGCIDKVPAVPADKPRTDDICKQKLSATAYYMEGGNCTIQLFEGGRIVSFWGCGDFITELPPAPRHSDLGEIPIIAGEDVQCIEIIKREDKKAPPDATPPPPTEQVLACINGNLQLTSDKTSHIYIPNRIRCDAICKPENAGGQNVECVKSNPIRLVGRGEECKGTIFRRAGDGAMLITRYYCRVVPE